MITHSRIQKTSIPIILVSLVSLILPISSSVAADGMSFAISPRAYLTSIDTGDYSEIATVPLGGLSFTFGPKGGNWDLTFNGLVGSGDSDLTLLSDNTWGLINSGKFEIDRADYEVLWRYRLKDSPVYVGVGARYVDAEERYISTDFGLLETDFSEITLGEFAVGFSTQVTEGSRHSMFGNLLIGLGTFDYKAVEVFTPDELDDGTSFIVDANIGYQYVMTEVTSFSARYRVIAVGSSGELTQQDTVQGPEVAFTFRF